MQEQSDSLREARVPRRANRVALRVGAVVVALVASTAVKAINHGPAAAAPTTSPSSATTKPTEVPLATADPKALAALLPATVGQLKRGDIDAGDRSMGEMHSAIAQATYSDDPTTTPAAAVPHATIKIVDYIAMPGLIESVAPWQSLDIARQSEGDYTRTITVNSFKGLETYTTQTRSGSLNVVVVGRFVVTIEVASLPPETMRETAKAMKLDALEAMTK